MGTPEPPNVEAKSFDKGVANSINDNVPSVQKNERSGSTAGGSTRSAKLSDYKKLVKLGEGTFSEVIQVRHRETGQVVALKRFKKHFNSVVEIENLREIQALKRLKRHPNIINLVSVIYEPKSGTLCLAMELMENNLYEVLSNKSNVITEAKAKVYMYQVLKALDYIHSCGIFHRDIKPENILVKKDLVKLADFGSCRSAYSKAPFTEYIATRWYRSPECLLCNGMYGLKMDIWGAGCVLYEVLTKLPLFPGTDELDQLHKIHCVLGSPNQNLLHKMLGNKLTSSKMAFPYKDGTGLRRLLPSASEEFVQVLSALLAYDPESRLTAAQALQSAWFKYVQIDFVSYATAPISDDPTAKESVIPSSASTLQLTKSAIAGSAIAANQTAHKELKPLETAAKMLETGQEVSSASSEVPLAVQLLKKKQDIVLQNKVKGSGVANLRSKDRPSLKGVQVESKHLSHILQQEATTLLKSTEDLHYKNSKPSKDSERRNRGHSIYGDLLSIGRRSQLPTAAGSDTLSPVRLPYLASDTIKSTLHSKKRLTQEYTLVSHSSKWNSMPPMQSSKPDVLTRVPDASLSPSPIPNYGTKSAVYSTGGNSGETFRQQYTKGPTGFLGSVRPFVPEGQALDSMLAKGHKQSKTHMLFHDAHLAKISQAKQVHLSQAQEQSRAAFLPSQSPNRVYRQRLMPVESGDGDNLPLYMSLTGANKQRWTRVKEQTVGTVGTVAWGKGFEHKDCAAPNIFGNPTAYKHATSGASKLSDRRETRLPMTLVSPNKRDLNAYSGVTHSKHPWS